MAQTNWSFRLIPLLTDLVLPGGPVMAPGAFNAANWKTWQWSEHNTAICGTTAEYLEVIATRG